MLRIGHSGAAHSVGAILDVRAVGPIVRFDTGFAKTDKRRELWLTAAQQRQRRSGPIHDDPRIISNLSVWWHDRRLRLVLLVDQRAMHVSAGETFCPLQLPSTCAIAIGLPLLTFVEDSLNSASAGVAAAANAAPKISARILPSSTTRPLGTARPATAPPVVG